MKAILEFELPEHQKKDTIEMLKRSVADMGRTLGL